MIATNLPPERPEMPTLQAFVSLLEELAGLSDLEVDVPLVDLGISSLDFLQWLFEIDDRLGIDSGELIDMETVGRLDLRALHETLRAACADVAGSGR